MRNLTTVLAFALALAALASCGRGAGKDDKGNCTESLQNHIRDTNKTMGDLRQQRKYDEAAKVCDEFVNAYGQNFSCRQPDGSTFDMAQEKRTCDVIRANRGGNHGGGNH